MKILLLLLTTCALFAKNPEVILYTNMGEIKMELYPDKAPITVENFLGYVSQGFYNHTIFHRVIKGFMIQGGGLSENFQEKKTQDPIKNEAGNGLKNKLGAVSMARTGIVDSATAQFFINTTNNDFLNHKNGTTAGFGYCVFGQVISGMDVVEKIEKVQTGHNDVPLKNVVIEKAVLIK